MNKLKKNQLGPWCTFCPPKTTKATHVQYGWNGHFACVNHKQELINYETEKYEIDNSMSEGDYQSWGRL